MEKKISVSKLLNFYFDPIDINSYPIQRGIFRGVVLDWAIENYYKNNVLKPPPKEYVLKRITNKKIINEFDLINEEAKKCIAGFKKFKEKNNLKINKVQKYLEIKNIKNETSGEVYDLKVYGFSDAFVTINDKEYLVDWKTKGNFNSYNYHKDEKWWNFTKLNDKYKKISALPLTKIYSLSNLRYCLQISLYYLMANEPKNVKPIILFFDKNENYYAYGFNYKKAYEICLKLIAVHCNDNNESYSLKNKEFKLKDWIKFVDWKRIIL